MPSVLRINGFNVYIYTGDHLPMHVHVIRAEAEVIINTEDLQIRDIFGMKAKDVKTELKIVADNQQFLLSKWDRIKPVP